MNKKRCSQIINKYKRFPDNLKIPYDNIVLNATLMNIFDIENIIKDLEDIYIDIYNKNYYGISTASIIAVFLAAGYNADEINKIITPEFIKKHIFGKNFNKFKKFDNIIKKCAFHKGKRLEKFINKNLKNKLGLKRNPIMSDLPNLHLLAWKFDSNKLKIHDFNNTEHTIGLVTKACCAFPILISPVEIDDKIYSDSIEENESLLELYNSIDNPLCIICSNDDIDFTDKMKMLFFLNKNIKHYLKLFNTIDWNKKIIPDIHNKRCIHYISSNNIFNFKLVLNDITEHMCVNEWLKNFNM